jgi:hypothetical protein
VNNAPKWYLPVLVVALLWNALGCFAYLKDVSLTPDDIAKMTPAAQAMYHARPAWSVAATAIAVWAGLAGCLGLLLRKRWGTPLLIASLLGVIVQDVSLYLMAGGNLAPAVPILQGLVLAIAVALVMLGRKATDRGWLG